MQCSLAFSHSPSGLFLVLLEVSSPLPGFGSGVSVANFQDENEFIHNAVLAISRQDLLVEIVTDVLLTVAEQRLPAAWRTVEVSSQELSVLGLAPG